MKWRRDRPVSKLAEMVYREALEHTCGVSVYDLAVAQFLVQDYLKVPFARATFMPPNEIVIDCFNQNKKQIFIRPKGDLLENIRVFLNIDDSITIRMRRRDEIGRH